MKPYYTSPFILLISCQDIKNLADNWFSRLRAVDMAGMARDNPESFVMAPNNVGIEFQDEPVNKDPLQGYVYIDFVTQTP